MSDRPTSSPIPTDLEGLKAAAEKATAGPWSQQFHFGEEVMVAGLDGSTVAVTAIAPRAQRSPIRDRSNATYIALANPATILALINRAQSAEAALAAQWEPTHRHVGRGTTYRLVAQGSLQTAEQAIWDETPLTIYRGEDGRWWARPTAEFEDGRFEVIADG